MEVAPEQGLPSPLETQMSTLGQQSEGARYPLEEGRRWYVMQTKPHQEARAIAHLLRRTQAVEPFLPKIEVVRRRARRRITIREPLFPGYVFLNMALTAWTWNAVRWSPGARRILGDGERPIAVPEELIRQIAERLEPLGFIRPGPRFSAGARVRVASGPFAGLEGIFERPTTRRDRVRVLLDVLGGVTPLELDVFDLESA